VTESAVIADSAHRSLPAIGFGTSPLRPGGRRIDVEPAVRAALAAGCRLLDVAELYGNERAVGRALRDASTRESVRVVGKAWRTSFEPAALRRACEASLARLGIAAFEAYLLHAPEAWRHRAPLADAEEIGWEELERRATPRDTRGAPAPAGVPLATTWAAMQELVRHGLAARVGVSNFTAAQLAELEPLPAVHQIACSPYAPQRPLVEFCRARGIELMAYSPLSPRGLLAEPALVALAAARGCTPAQVVLAWNVRRGLVPLFSSTDPAHVAENLRAPEVDLDAAALAIVDGLERRS
jgi:alcohol dehydrogenase (NADP+)